MAVLGLHCRKRALSSCSEQRSLSSCPAGALTAEASLEGAVGASASVAVVLDLSCSSHVGSSWTGD